MKSAQNIDYLELTKTLLAEHPVEILLKGMSMFPTLKEGERAVIEQISDLKTLRKGDIIAFRKDAEIICHRVLKIEETGDKTLITTAGDNNNLSDKAIEFEDVYGKMISHKTKKGLYQSSGSLKMKFYKVLFINLPWITKKFYKVIQKLKKLIKKQ
ncbi:MAG: signal peptidase I [Paludibacter sp.]|jgi:signal peptidase I|nr:signal peptidase I [Paludibacter sp.]